MSRIEHLTAEQEARFTEFVEKWTAIGLSTEPADRPAAEAAIAEMYRCGGLKPPARIVWCGSPLSMALTRAIVLNKNSACVWDSVWDSVGGSVWDSVGNNVGNSVRGSVWDSVRDSVWDSVWDSVGGSVWDSVGNNVGNSVRGSVWDSVGTNIRGSVYGAHEAFWLAFYDYFRQVCGLINETEKLAGLFALAKSAGWAIPHQNICWVSERHNVLHRNERGRLHNLNGPALGYPDGWGIYAVHGVRVRAQIIEHPDQITGQQILGEPNTEIRRVMIERMGHERFLREVGAQPVQEDRRGRLFRIDLPDDEPLVLVEVLNATPEPATPDDKYLIHKRYLLRVPPTMQTAAAAVAWTFGRSAEEYAPLVET